MKPQPIITPGPVKPEPFKSWAVIEIMGHSMLAGLCIEQTVAGATMLRCDVPEIPARQEEPTSWSRGELLPAIPGYTRYLGAAAIFSITPCTEEAARAVLDQRRPHPTIPLGVPARPELTLPAPSDEDDDQDEDEVVSESERRHEQLVLDYIERNG